MAIGQRRGIHIYLKEISSSIKKNFKRFLALVCIIVLSIGFFVGMKTATVDMKKSMSDFFERTNLMDVAISSTFGISYEDLSELMRQDSEIVEAEGGYRVDLPVMMNGTEAAIAVNSYSENQKVNQLELVEGRLPEGQNECVVGETLVDQGYKVGDILEISNDVLKEKQLVISGVVRSPMFISHELGSTNILSGSLDHFIYMNAENFLLENYTVGFLKLRGVGGNFSEEYMKNIEAEKQKILDLLEAKTTSRLSDARKDYEKQTALANMGIIVDTQELDRLEVEILKQSNIKWQVQTRDDNFGYGQYSDDIARISNLGTIFPITFFLVAVFVALTSVSRMIDEDRIMIGTCVANGYTKMKILLKYVIYATVAVIVGAVLGILVGTYGLPQIFYNVYEIIYFLPTFSINFSVLYSIIGFLLCLLPILLSVYFACKSTLEEMPADLLRPKVEKAGRDPWLSRVDWIWRRLKLMQKVSMRNIFLYKKRLFMTLIGVGGCCALIVAGLALKDSITKIVKIQYGEIFNMDVQLIYNEGMSEQTVLGEAERILGLEEVGEVALAELRTLNAKQDNKIYNVQMVVPDNFNDFREMVHLRDVGTGEDLTLPSDGVIVSAKLAELLGLKVGGVLVLQGDDSEYMLKVKGITENYVFHYAYLGDEYYREVFGEEVENNMLLVDTEGVTDEKVFAQKLNANSAFAKIDFVSRSEDIYRIVMDSMSMIVLVIILAAGILNFVVLFNLSNINITERKKELATLKVLGFKQREINAYIKTEMWILEIAGIVIGLVAGYFLSILVIKTCEIDSMMFYTKVDPIFYLYAALITLAFSIISGIFVNRMLDKIDMVTSLKRVS